MENQNQKLSPRMVVNDLTQICIDRQIHPKDLKVGSYTLPSDRESPFQICVHADYNDKELCLIKIGENEKCFNEHLKFLSAKELHELRKSFIEDMEKIIEIVVVNLELHYTARLFEGCQN